ncbi:MAG: hypothetical protein ACU84Q_20110, partial [Gammaproteobacteria bacterium]
LLFQHLARGDPPQGDDVHPIADVAASGHRPAFGGLTIRRNKHFAFSLISWIRYVSIPLSNAL